MRILAVDIGSSSVKAAYCAGGRIGPVARVALRTTYRGVEVEIPARGILTATGRAIRQAMHGHTPPDALAFDTFSPGLVIMDRLGRPVAGAITHQDRRSVPQAYEIERRVGKSRHLAIAGNRPFPGGIASTSLLWLKENAPQLLPPAFRIGQPSTLLFWHWTGRPLIDPSQAAFLGLYDIRTGRWSETLCAALGIPLHALPEIAPADQVRARLLASAARQLGLPAGLPVLGGLVDTSAAVCGTNLTPGTLVHNSGSTDVLALVLNQPRPALDILSRPLGTGHALPARALAVSTIAAAGSAIQWARQTLFSELPEEKFHATLRRAICTAPPAGLTCQPTFAGDRTSVEQLRAAFDGLTLSTRREDLLSALAHALLQASCKRYARLAKLHRIGRTVSMMGGQSSLGDAMHRAWPRRHAFRALPGEALAGLVRLAEAALERGA